MSMPTTTEAKISVIPRVVKYGFGSVREYSVLLTDRRMIFVMASLSRAHLAAAALGGSMGAAVAAGSSKDLSGESLDSAVSDEPDALASHEGSLVIPYSGISLVLLKKYPADYELVLDYRDARGKKDRLRMQVGAPDAYFQRAREMGMDNKTARRNYASEVQAALVLAFPPSVAAVARWDF